MNHKTNNASPASSLTNKWFWIVCAIYSMLIILACLRHYSLVLLGKVENFEWDTVFEFVLPTNIIGIIIACITFRIYNRSKDNDSRRTWTHYLLYSILIGLIYGFLYHTFLMTNWYFFGSDQENFTLVNSLKRFYKFVIPSSITGITHFWAITTLFFALDFYDQFKDQSYRSLQLESQLNDSKLKNLRMQLNPHFLFNALNTVSMMVRKDKKSPAINMISGISDLLRSSLNMSNDQFISFKEEIELLKKYLYIEEQRFSDRLKVEYDINQNIWEAMVPNLLLQPLVENALKYGVANNINEAYIKISATEKNERLWVRVYNKGNLLQTSVTEGIGLKNTRSRLEISYDNYGFDLKNAEDKSGVVATIEIPMKYD